MKKLSYFAKSQIFLWTSVAVSVLDIFVAFPLLVTVWGILFGIGCYYWGRNTEAHKNTMDRLDAEYRQAVAKLW